jgi:hypothetical protein
VFDIKGQPASVFDRARAHALEPPPNLDPQIGRLRPGELVNEEQPTQGECSCGR